MRRLRYLLKPLEIIVILFFFLVFGVVHCAQGDANTVYAILGHSAVITCNSYDTVKAADNSTGSITDIFSLRWFKNQRSSDYIVFTYLYMFNHKTEMPQNDWTARNVTFSIKDQPQIRLPNVTFSDEAIYICDVTPVAGIAPVLYEKRLKVVACPETVVVAVINFTSPSLPSVRKIGKNDNNPIALSSDSAVNVGVLTFARGTRIMVRCSTVTFPDAEMSISIAGLQLDKPEWQNLTEMMTGNGYVKRTLDAWFALDGPDNQLHSQSLSIDCKASVGNGTCDNISSLRIQLLERTTSLE